MKRSGGCQGLFLLVREEVGGGGGWSIGRNYEAWGNKRTSMEKNGSTNKEKEGLRNMKLSSFNDDLIKDITLNLLKKNIRMTLSKK